ncbi:hypothetical protein [Nocardioides ferulae]|uniref:hypothetical protein n=1 Tax=Nocardioides ferulae TaxID=2340821 RepID=UPI000EAF37E7|nr:hypothetical protein [Nocardioides ferulae]
MKNQPSPLASTSVTNTGRGGAGVRTFAAEVVLIRNWVELIRQCASVTAHGPLGGQLPNCEELLGLLDVVEDAIRCDIRDGAALLDRLADWETSLLHVAPQVPPSDCLICQRAKAIPEAMPAEYAWALRVIDEAS